MLKSFNYVIIFGIVALITVVADAASDRTISTNALKYYEQFSNGTDSVTIKPPNSLGADYTITLPPDDGDANQVLTTDGAGVLSWGTRVESETPVSDDSIVRYDGTTGTLVQDTGVSISDTNVMTWTGTADIQGTTGVNVNAVANDVDIVSAAGEVDIDGQTNVAITGVTGNVQVIGQTGVSAQANTGNVGMTAVAGDVDLTGNVNVDLTATTGNVTATATAGSVDLTASATIDLSAGTAVTSNADIQVNSDDVTITAGVNPKLTITDTTGPTTFQITQSDGNALIGTTTANGVDFQANGTTRMTLTSAGDLDVDAMPQVTASQVMTTDADGELATVAQLPITQGGTGQATAQAGFDALSPATTTGDLIYNDGVNNSALGIGTPGQHLEVVGGVPSWQTIDVDLTAEVSGALPIANGGTGQITATAGFDALSPTTTTGDIIYNDGVNNVRLAAGTPGQHLETVGGVPSWQTIDVDLTAEVSGALPIANGGTGQTTQTEGFDALAPTTTEGDMVYYTAGDNARLPVGPNGSFLQVVGGVPAWSVGGTTDWGSIPDGTEAIPSLRFFSETGGDSGWYKPADGEWSWSADATRDVNFSDDGIKIDNNLNVGGGISQPADLWDTTGAIFADFGLIYHYGSFGTAWNWNWYRSNGVNTYESFGINGNTTFATAINQGGTGEASIRFYADATWAPGAAVPNIAMEIEDNNTRWYNDAGTNTATITHEDARLYIKQVCADPDGGTCTAGTPNGAEIVARDDAPLIAAYDDNNTGDGVRGNFGVYDSAGNNLHYVGDNSATLNLLYVNSTGGIYLNAGNTGTCADSAACSSQVYLQDDGSYSDPALSWWGDSDTGFVHSADAIGIGTGGAARLVISNTVVNSNEPYQGPNFYADTYSTQTAPSVFGPDQNTGLYFATGPVWGLSANGVENIAASSTNVVVNEDSANMNFRVESDVSAYNFWVRGSDGLIGINDSSPTAQLDVNGTTATVMRWSINNGEDGTLNSIECNANGRDRNYFVLNNSTTSTAYWFGNDGNFRGGTSGSITCNGTDGGQIIGSQPSDERLKKDIEPLEYGLDEVLKLKPISYYMTASGKYEIGFGAQTTRDIIPEAVYDTKEPFNGDKENTKLAMEYSRIVPVLVKAIQELNEKNEALAAEIKALKGN